MPNIYARNLPRDLLNDLKEIKKILGTKTWVTFLYEANRRIRIQLREEGRLSF